MNITNFITDIPSVASTIAKAAIVILVVFSYPLQVHPCRASVDAVLKWRPAMSKNTQEPRVGSPSRSALLHPLSSAATHSGRNESIGEVKFAIITSIILILSYFVAMTVSSFDRVLAYVGATGSTSISFILPGLFYYKISDPDSIYQQRLAKEDDDEYDGVPSDEGSLTQGAPQKSQWSAVLLRRMSLALAIYGFAVMITCLTINTVFIVAH